MPTRFHDLGESLIGRAGSRAAIPTPALICDIGLLESNISTMARWASEHSVALRPHVKSHKSALVAALQLRAGARGLAFAKPSEAEAVVRSLIRHGWTDPVNALITSPVAPAAVAALGPLAEICCLTVVVDEPEAIDELATVGSDSNPLLILCDVDVGLGRTGVRTARDAVAVVKQILRHRTLRFEGVQGYGGHLQHLADRSRRQAATTESTEHLATIIAALEKGGYEVPWRSGGGTGTCRIDAELGVLNELQPGSYVFMDREYADSLGDDAEGVFAHSLFVATTVVSANQAAFVTVDAGLKSMATDAGPPAVVNGATSVEFQFFGDEHGLVTRDPDRLLQRGDRLELVAPHCDPTVDRYDVMWLVSGDTVVGVTPVDARGCSQ